MTRAKLLSYLCHRPQCPGYLYLLDESSFHVSISVSVCVFISVHQCLCLHVHASVCGWICLSLCGYISCLLVDLCFLLSINGLS